MKNNFILEKKIKNASFEMTYIFLLEEEGYKHRIKIRTGIGFPYYVKTTIVRLDDIAVGHIELEGCDLSENLQDYSITSPYFNIKADSDTKEEFISYFNYLYELADKINILKSNIKNGMYENVEEEIWKPEPIEEEE